MKDEIELHAQWLETVADNIQEYATELKKAHGPFSKASSSLQERGKEFVKSVQTLSRDIANLAERHAGEAEAEDIRKVGYDASGEMGSLAATVDMATGEIPSERGAKIGVDEVARDFMRTAEYLRHLAARLSKVPAR